MAEGPGHILVLGDAFYWTAGGLVCGLAGAIASARCLRGLLFHVSAASPLAYLSAAFVMAAVALAATLLPSMRAARVDPATTLKDE
jgi:ABC-type lipoprotein release transport system permease subunit